MIDHVTDPPGYAQPLSNLGHTNRRETAVHFHFTNTHHTQYTEIVLISPLGVLHHEGETQSDITHELCDQIKGTKLPPPHSQSAAAQTRARRTTHTLEAGELLRMRSLCTYAIIESITCPSGSHT